MSRLSEVTSGVLAAGVESVPWRGDISAEYFEDEIGPILKQAITSLLSAFASGRLLSRSEVSMFMTPLVELSTEGEIPLPFLITAMHGGIRRLWEFVAEYSSDSDAASLASLGMYLAELAGTVTVMVSEAYQNSTAGGYVERRWSGRLCAALVSGKANAMNVAREGNLDLCDHYNVIAVHVDSRAGPQSAQDQLTTWRRMRYAQRILYDFGPNLVLNTFDGCSGIVLLPSAMNISGAAHGADAAIVAALSERLGVPIYAATRPSTQPSAIPAAAAEATEIARLARQVGRVPGLYQLEDVLLEYQITRPSPARDLLAQCVVPLQRHPMLLEALKVHLRHGSARKAAAAELFIHPNTLTYRLGRIRDITDIDPMDPHGARVLAAALTLNSTTEPAPACMCE
ncbi:transcriptional regulator [Mycobacteroides stephanolepidis]|uniref:Transcriptional regulator n=1 Tax=[Mycobacterium] stephanolepidis TaxID=1520670 RepID=A0A1Z4F0I3_9MYCO|nr:helix-turn-helix domain-containing protein [[Mycobacterium] stephanolepidis]BAX98704.1 transcriptional regulator [[Mycobacterium] stephanolepidis]